MSERLAQLRQDIADAQALVKSARNLFNVDPSKKDDLDFALQLLADAKSAMANAAKI